MIYIKRYLLLFVVVFWVSTIFYMSSKPGDESAKTSFKIVDVITKKLNLGKEQAEKVHFLTRKAAHFTEYFILSFLITLTYSEFNNRKLNISFILLSCVLVAIGDEFLQSFIEGRGSQVRDVIIDFGGSLAQLLAFIFIKTYTRKTKRSKLKFN